MVKATIQLWLATWQVFAVKTILPAASCPTIITRAEWGARAPVNPPQTLPATPNHIYIHHGATAGCTDQQQCEALVRSYQNFHIDSRGWDDIGYSFLVGEDGRVYQGRGWTVIGAHTYRHNTDGLGFCVIGDFSQRVPNLKALTAIRDLIQCAVDSGYVRPDYILLGHRDVGSASGPTECPGDAFYREIKTWPHYNSTT